MNNDNFWKIAPASEIDNLLILSSDNKDKSVIDSLNLSGILQKLYSALENSYDNIEIIKISRYLCRELHGIFFMPNDREKLVINSVVNAVKNGRDLSAEFRLSFLRYIHPTIPFNISQSLRENNISEMIERIYYFQILKFIVHSHIVTNDIKTSVLDEFESMFQSDEITLKQKMEIADIYIINNRRERGEEMLNILRNTELLTDDTLESLSVVEMLIRKRLVTIYNDYQNIHTGDINRNVLDACVFLIEKEGVVNYNIDNVRKTLTKLAPKHTDKINTVLERVQIDTSKFTVDNNQFNLEHVFGALWSYIQKHEYSIEMCLRLIEEMCEMADYCSTGHLSRFINVLQGFAKESELLIKISTKDQAIAVVSNYLTKECEKAGDEILESMIGTDQQHFYEFIEKIINKELHNILSEYEFNIDNIITTIKTFTAHENWYYNENEKCIKHGIKQENNESIFRRMINRIKSLFI